MNQEFDFVFLSIFGRGNWLAGQMAKKGFRVALVDVSGQMGHWTPEDWEGPFGFFRTDRLEDSQIERLTEDSPVESVDQGFTIWTGQGPLECKGVLADYGFRSMGFTDEVKEYVLRYEWMSPEERHRMKASVAEGDFSQTWFAHLAHQVSSNVLVPDSSAIHFGHPLPLFTPYLYRRVSRRDIDRSLHDLARAGVTVYPEAKVMDVSKTRKKIDGVEVASDFSGALFAKKYVWMLSSEETESCPESVLKTLFPDGALKPQWYWSRFRVTAEEGVPLEVLPNKFLVIQDVNVAWTHTNFYLVERTVKKRDMDIWCRLPSRQRFHRAYIESVVGRCAQSLSEKLGLSVEVAQMPQDYLYDRADVGAPRFPIFLPGELARYRSANLSNVIFDGPERWAGLDWLSQLERHAELAKEMTSPAEMAEPVEAEA